MGSKSSKSSATTSSATTSTTTSNESIHANSTDNEGVSVIADGAVNLNITGAEAFQLAADVTTNALEAIRSSNADTLQGARDFAERQNKDVLDFATENAAPAAASIEKIIKYGALAGIAYAGLKIYGK